MIVCIVIRRVKYMFRFILYLIKFLLPLYFSSYVHGFTPYAGPNWRESRGFIPAVPLKNVYITSNRGYSLSNSYIRRNPPLLSLADYAMDRKRGLGPNSSRRWGKRLEREMKHSYGNVAGNEDVGGCNPDYKFAETYFEDDEIGQWPPQEVTTHTGSLIIHLKNKNGGPYGSYKSLQGEWRLVNSPISLIFDRIQSDPFAPPSSIRLRVPNSIHRFPDDVITDKLRNVAACDAITRKICDELKVLSSKAKYGSDRKHFQMMNPSQYVLPRKTVVLTDRYLEARMFAHMPANGRRINGTLAVYMFNEILPALVRNAMNYSAYDSKQFYEHIYSVEDQEALRAQLDALGLVAFVGNGSILPRASGVSEMPLKGPGVQPFESPASLQISVTLPNKGTITGLGLKRGVNLIVGGGYHGKTTLLEALQVGCYNKVPGDGREFVVTSRNAVKVRAEDGRSVGSIDISTFIGTLPSGKDCNCFSTTDASGSTSQAAVIMESIEMGADLLLIDEDISATNFMYRDHMMDSLVSSNCEPITTFLLLVQAFYQKLGVSTILVSGACGLFMDQADTVIQMNQYKCLDKTEEAKLVVSQHNVNLKEAIDKAVDNCSLFKTHSLNNRVLSYTTFKRPSEKVRHHGIGTIQYGTENIDLSLVEQLVEVGQTSAITNILIYLEQLYREQRDAVHNKTLREVLELLYSKWDKDGNSPGYNGLDDINGFRHYPAGDCSMPRVFEVAAAINRMRSLKVADFKQQQFTPQQY